MVENIKIILFINFSYNYMIKISRYQNYILFNVFTESKTYQYHKFKFSKAVKKH